MDNLGLIAAFAAQLIQQDRKCAMMPGCYSISILKVKQYVGRALPDSLIRRAQPALQKCTPNLELELFQFALKTPTIPSPLRERCELVAFLLGIGITPEAHFSFVLITPFAPHYAYCER